MSTSVIASINCAGELCDENHHCNADATACIPNCFETDFGINQNNAGVVTAFIEEYNEVRTYADYCEDDGRLREYHCGYTGRVYGASDPCAEGRFCYEGECIEACENNFDCLIDSSSRCDAGGDCSACISNSDCSHIAGKPICEGGVCRSCLADSECTQDDRSRCSWGICASCVDNSDCTHISGKSNCDSGVCVAEQEEPRNPVVCNSDFDCLDGFVCSNSACVVPPPEQDEPRNPISCVVDEDCLDGFECGIGSACVQIQVDPQVQPQADPYSEFILGWRELSVVDIIGTRNDGTQEELHYSVETGRFEEGLSGSADATVRLTQSTLEEIAENRELGRSFFTKIRSGEIDFRLTQRDGFFNRLGNLLTGNFLLDVFFGDE